MAIQTTPPPGPASVLAGFTRVNGNIKKRMIMSIEGDWGTGKTDLALTAPAPIAFFKWDLNCEFTLSQWATKKVIYQKEYDVVDPNDPNAQKKSEDLIRAFGADYAAALKARDIRTVIWDTATEVWEQFRMAAFGKLSQVLPHHYPPVNNSFRILLRAAYESDTNLILIHRLKDEWENTSDPQTGREKGKKTGSKKRAGFNDLGFAVQVMVQTLFDPEDGQFSMKVLKCTQNPMITQHVYGQAGDLRMNSFPVLATDVFPGTSLEEWE